MVKKIISSILGKKETQSETKESEDIPDELPPLAEDIINTQRQDKENIGVSVSKETKPVPDELPSLEVSTKKEDTPEHGTIEDLDKAGQNLLREISAIGDDDIKNKKEGQKSSETAGELKTKQYADDSSKEKSELGFFSNILEQIKKHSDVKERLLGGNLFSRMENYWDIRKHEIKTGEHLPTEKKLEDDLIKKLKELKILEQKWQMQKLALEEDIRYLHQREREIQAKVREVSMISNELSLFRTVKPEEYFHIRNGMVLKNLHDLIDTMEIIDDDTFNHHVNKDKNDFSEWVRHVFKDNNLADNIKNTKTGADIVRILETVPLTDEEDGRSIHIINPKKYFWLANGAVIRNLYELSDSLKSMGDELFSKHVHSGKNDFAEWVGVAIKDKQLEPKLMKAKTRKEMIDILDSFL